MRHVELGPETTVHHAPPIFCQVQVERQGEWPTQDHQATSERSHCSQSLKVSCLEESSRVLLGGATSLTTGSCQRSRGLTGP